MFFRRHLGLTVGLLLMALPAMAKFSYEGYLTDSSGNALVSQSVQLKLQIFNPGSTCQVFQETQALTTGADGYFSVAVGSGTPSGSPLYSVDRVFQNQGTMSPSSPSSCNYTPSLGDERVMKVSVSSDGGTTWDLLSGSLSIYPSPSAGNADYVGGIAAANLMRVTSGTSGTVSAFTMPQYNQLVNLANGSTATGYMTSNTTSGASLPSVSSAPSSPVAGSLWYNSSTHTLNFYDGTSNQTLGTGGGGTTGVSLIATSSNLTVNGTPGGAITTTGSLDLANSGVTAGSYTRVTVDAKGRVTMGSVTLPSDMPALSGDVSGSAGTLSVVKIRGIPVSATSPATGQLLVYNGSQYTPSALNIDSIVSSISGAQFFPTNCTAGQTMTWQSGTDTMICSNISVSLSGGTSAISGTLGVANGGTGSTNGSIVGTGSLTIAAGGSGQNIVLSPSSSGSVLIPSTSSKVGIGTSSPTYPLTVNGNTTSNIALFTSNVSGGQPASLAIANTYGGSKATSLNFLTTGSSLMWAIGTDYNSSSIPDFYIYNSLVGAPGFYINQNNNVGIGTISPMSTLNVVGTSTFQGQVKVQGPIGNDMSHSVSGSIVDFSQGNMMYTTNSCGVFNLNNMKDGATYTFAVQGTSSATCSFAAYSDNGSTAITLRLPADFGPTAAGKHTLFTFMVMGGYAYVGWNPGM